jgi:hypothetical protein
MSRSYTFSRSVFVACSATDLAATRYRSPPSRNCGRKRLMSITTIAHSMCVVSKDFKVNERMAKPAKYSAQHLARDNCAISFVFNFRSPVFVFLFFIPSPPLFFLSVFLFSPRVFSSYFSFISYFFISLYLSSFNFLSSSVL